MQLLPSSFRFKLILAMMVLVAGATSAVLYLTQRHVQVRYDRMFRAQFDGQIAYFTTLRDSRLGTVKELSLKLAEKPRIIAGLDQVPPAADVLYDLRDQDMRSLRADLAEENRMAQPSDSRKSATLMIRFLDAAGKVIPPPASLVIGPGNARRLEQKMSTLRSAIDAPQRQEILYLVVGVETNAVGWMRRLGHTRHTVGTNEPNEHVLQEVIVTKVIDAASNRPLGALMVAFQVPALIPTIKSEHGVAEPESIHSGILLEDHLYGDSASMPEAIGSAAEQACSKQIERRKTDRGEFGTRLDGKSYRVFYQALNPGAALAHAYQVCLYSTEESKHEQRNLRDQVLSVGFAALLVALLFSLLLSHGLSIPIRKLLAGTREIRTGNYQVKLPASGGDELGELARSFNEMAEGLAQKERYRTLLNQLADEKIAQQLISGEIKLGGEMREVSVLFCDIRGFTALTQSMSPPEVIDMLNEHMSTLSRVVRQYNGVLDKFVGDLLMAIFGAPVQHGNDVLAAAHCALELLRARAALNNSSRHQLSIGIGIATGNVVAGAMGSSERFHYTVLGERVNLASRLCAQAKPGEILIDEESFAMLRDKVTVEPLPSMALKGFSQPVRAFRLLSVRS